MKKKTKIILITIMTIIVLSPLLINLYVILNTTSNIIIKEEYQQLKDVDYILVLGASVRRERPSPMLEDRLKKAIELYNINTQNKILVTGDHTKEDYDEVTIMKNYLLENNIPEEKIIMDPAGVSTYDSIFRVQKQLKAKKIIVVSQKYHLYRALYIANSLGIEAYGVPADDIKYKGATYREVREILARNKDFIKSIIKPTSYYQKGISEEYKKSNHK